AYELVLPARLALDVQDRTSACGNIHDVRTLVVDDVALALERIEHEPKLVRSGLARRHFEIDRRRRARSRQVHLAREDELIAIVDAQSRLARTVVTNADLRDHHGSGGR